MVLKRPEMKDRIHIGDAHVVDLDARRSAYDPRLRHYKVAPVELPVSMPDKISVRMTLINILFSAGMISLTLFLGDKSGLWIENKQ